MNVQLDLEHECESCHGCGKRFDHQTGCHSDKPCWACEGTGVETTAEGKTILEFVRNRLRGLLREIREEDREAGR